jgi:hypothetical protein
MPPREYIVTRMIGKICSQSVHQLSKGFCDRISSGTPGKLASQSVASCSDGSRPLRLREDVAGFQPSRFSITLCSLAWIAPTNAL